jgi:arylsulfatase A-like enzyme
MGEYRLMPGKMTAFDTDIRVPLIVTGPGVPAGRTSADLVQNIDLRPTLEELAGTQTPATVDGHSFAALLRGENPSDWRTAVLVEHHRPIGGSGVDPDVPNGDANPPSYEAVRTATALYVEYADGQREYYDTVRDPDELHNTVDQLPPAEPARLHSALVAMTGCHDNTTCWSAQHVLP